jgi:hypothetical protein
MSIEKRIEALLAMRDYARVVAQMRKDEEERQQAVVYKTLNNLFRRLDKLAGLPMRAGGVTGAFNLKVCAVTPSGQTPVEVRCGDAALTVLHAGWIDGDARFVEQGCNAARLTEDEAVERIVAIAEKYFDDSSTE